MARTLYGLLAVALVALAAFAAYSIYSGSPEGGGDRKPPPDGPAGTKHFADALPRETILYARLRGLETLKDRVILPGSLTNAEGLQKKVDAAYADLIASVGEQNPFGLPAASCKKYIAGMRSIHLAFLPQTGTEPAPVAFVEMANGDVVKDFIKEMAGKIKEKDLEGVKVYEVEKGPEGLLHVMDGNVLLWAPQAALKQVLKTRAAGKAASLAGSKPFQIADQDWGDKGDAFFIVSVERLRTLDLFGPPKREVNQEGTSPSFAEFSYLAGSVEANGALNLRVYAAESKKLPEFLVRKPAPKHFLTRVPADAALVAAWTYEGGKNTRKSFSDWLKQEMKKGGADAVLANPVLKLIATNLEQLEDEVVVMVNDLWVAILPVKTEMELFIAPDAAGKWGGALFFDIDDKRQIEELKDHIFQAGTRAKLPWKVVMHKGVSIHYLDLEAIARSRGKPFLREPFADAVQTKVGYAQTDTLFLAGNVEAIKFVLDPKEPTFAEVVKYDRIDKANAMQMTLQAGKLLHSSLNFGPLEGLKKTLAGRIPKDSNLSISMSLEEKQATLKSNIPITTIAAWIALELQGGP